MGRLLFLTFLLLATLSKAQTSIDLARVGVQVSPSNELERAVGEVSINNYFFNTTLPLVLDSQQFILLSPNFNLLTLQYHESLQEDQTLYQIGFPIGYNRKFNSRWSGLILAIPRMSSDFADSDPNGFIIGGIGLVTLEKRKDLKYKFGAYVNRDLFGPMIVPLFGWYTKLGENWTFEGLAPINGSLSNQISKRSRMGIKFNAQVTSYRFEGGLAQDLPTDDYLHKITNELFLFTELDAFKNIVLRSDIGYSILRSYRRYGENDKLDAALSLFRFGDDRVQKNNDFQDGPLIRLQVIYRLPIPE